MPYLFNSLHIFIQFEEYKQNILNACLRKDIIDFKNFDVRTKLYMLIDNSGNAWIFK